MHMQSNPRTIDALFNSQLRYVIPMFQRLYVWQETPQWEWVRAFDITNCDFKLIVK